MTAMQLRCPDLLRQVSGRSTAAMGQDGERSGVRPADRPTRVIAQFQPLDPGIVSDAIPAFFIGRNMEGFWVARDANGQIGGIFLLRISAQSFARRNSHPKGCATIYPSERIELDLENKGNPLAVQLGSLMRLTRQCRQQLVALIGKMTKPVNRRLKDLLDL